MKEKKKKRKKNVEWKKRFFYKRGKKRIENIIKNIFKEKSQLWKGKKNIEKGRKYEWKISKKKK